MSQTKKIICTRCGAEVETSGLGDFTTFVCEACQERANLEAYKQEVIDIDKFQKEREDKKEERLPSFDKRKSFLEDKIEAIEEAIKKEAEEAEEAE